MDDGQKFFFARRMYKDRKEKIKKYHLKKFPKDALRYCGSME